MSASAATSQLVSLVIGLAFVLAIIAGAAWLMKRIAPRTLGNGSVLRVVAGTAVGPRERVVIVEVGSTWLVLGVAPGAVNQLHQMPREESVAALPAAPNSTPPFAQWLQKMIEKRRER